MQHRRKTVISLFGAISLRRAYYHCAACHRGEVPWDGQLRLSRRSLTLAAEEIAALAGTLSDFDATGVRQQGPGGRRREGRMAYVATVYNACNRQEDAAQQAHQARYLAALCDLASMGLQLSRHAAAVGFDDVQQQLAISDGGAGLEDVFRQHFPRAEVILDFWHAREHLVELAQELYPGDEAARQPWIEAHSHQLRHEGGAAVLHSLEALDLAGHRATTRQAYAEHVRYFRNHLHKMDYPRYRANGWQIGSGPVESACKTVVGRRLKQSGMRWGTDGADAVCHLRALHQSEPHRWRSFWQDYRT